MKSYNYLLILYREVEGNLLYRGIPRPIEKAEKVAVEYFITLWNSLIIYRVLGAGGYLKIACRGGVMAQNYTLHI